MDDIDRMMILIVCEDPRISVKDLAKKLGVSRQVAHHRIQALAKMGVFKKMTAEISFFSIGQVLVRIWGVSKSRAIEETLDRLGYSEYSSDACVEGGNEVSVLGCLPDISHLDDYVAFVRRVAEMPDPTVGILDFDDGINPEWMDGMYRVRMPEFRKPSPLDYRIVASLRDDARKPLAKIAGELGVSIKTVRRHLEALRSDGILDYHQVGDLTSGEDMLTSVYMNLRKGADKLKVGKHLLSLDPVHLQYVRSFSNLPNLLYCCINSQKMSEIRRLLKAISEDEDIVSATPNLVYMERVYTPYDIKELLVKGKGNRGSARPTKP